jgi:2-polyprenyl-3-methyl-5-hydroxy-6-metoxy-1,4-benzoquinol methylase
MNGSLAAPVGDELLDHPDADPAVVRESLRNIARANRWFGGWWAVRHGLARLLDGVGPGRRLTLLDIGAGLGDLPARARGWAARRGVELTPLGLERHPTAAGLAAQAGVPTALGAAPDLPFRDRSVDILTLSQILHHLPPPEILRLLGQARQIARLGVVVADLHRTFLALAGFWVGSRLLAFDPATRSDGITSVRRGFTPGELSDLLHRSGMDTSVERRVGYRLVAAWRREDER